MKDDNNDNLYMMYFVDMITLLTDLDLGITTIWCLPDDVMLPAFLLESIEMRNLWAHTCNKICVCDTGE